MLICSLACKSVFDGDQTKIISNIVMSVVVILAGVAGGLVYSIILSKKGEKPLAEKYAKLTQFFF
ncbi:MAG: hypothetical protein MJ223_00495 [Mycoplasmoidaceae bacterium]|nr:hypothetical protein [Mycoplasmoidaceae bacterium]